jgi:5-methylthioadenosine/S-adenosylhomocysteine deaminase
MKLCSGVMDMTLARSKQVCVSIGTDGSQSNNSLDLLRDLKSGILLQKVHLENPSFLSG